MRNKYYIVNVPPWEKIYYIVNLPGVNLLWGEVYFNKGEDGEVFKNPQNSEMECNCVRKITKGLFRKYNLYCESISVKVQ
jgi:hypothetical protein